MTYALVVTVELVSADKIDAFVQHFEPLLLVSNDPSVDPAVTYELLKDITDPEGKTLVILERFQSQPDHRQKHRSTDPFQAFSTWLRGPAQEEGEGRLVAKVSSKHLVNYNHECDWNEKKISVPESLVKLARVEKNVRICVSSPLSSASSASTSSSATSAAGSDPKAYKFKEISDGILVFGGAKVNVDKKYLDAAAAVGRSIGKTKRHLVFGGGSVGAMFHAADGANKENPGCVIGIIPKALAPPEISGELIGRNIICEDMNSRKKLMFACSSAVVTLAGGLGTLDELFEAITLFQLNALQHKIILVNTNNYYDKLLDLLKWQIQEGFVEEKALSFFHVFNEDPEKVDIMEWAEKQPLGTAGLKCDWSRSIL